MIKDSQKIQWWLVELDNHDNVIKVKDGSHSDQEGANEAYYLHQRLGFIKSNKKYAVVKMELFEPVPNKNGVNEEALDILNGIKNKNV